MAVIEPIWLQFGWRGGDAQWLFSKERQVVGEVEVPTWLEYRALGGSQPDMQVRIELRDDSPRVVQLSFTAGPEQNEVQQKHLREVRVDQLATDLLAYWIRADFTDPTAPRDDPHDHKRAEHNAIKFLERQRLPREYRVIDNDFLKRVADVYRKNIRHAPTKAVAEAFNVKNRTASMYVEKARKAGYLPETKQGQKRA